MRKFAAILGILALAACMAATYPPRPKAPLVTLSRHVTGSAGAGLVWVKWSVSAAGAPDSVVVTINSSVAPTVSTRKYVSAAITDSVSYPRPTFGVRINGDVNGKSWRRGLSALGVPKGWSYTEPADTAPPAPTVDSVRVTPTSATLAPGGSVLLTARVYKS